MTHYLELSLRCVLKNVAPIENLLIKTGAQAVMRRNGDTVYELLSHEGNWPSTRITAWLPLNAKMQDLRRHLADFAYDDLRIDFVESASKMRNVTQPQPLLTIGPFSISANAESAPHDGIPLLISPAMAFGTGEHPTTAMCLTWLGNLDLHERDVLDVGCGSGILAIAAKKRGARTVDAVDNDNEAQQASKANAKRNQVDINIHADIPIERRFDVICANIFAGTLIDFAAQIERVMRPNGRLALSGILAGQCTEVAKAYSRIRFEPPEICDEWALLTGTRAPN
ncbi:MAG: 50S ribosomal protein L11 methyltransferase [Gammaproteobacteria bacterium]|nr:50S ribosomal protein L11 methyltransferase [Gammaproteobacteria bacterium]